MSIDDNYKSSLIQTTFQECNSILATSEEIMIEDDEKTNLNNIIEQIHSTFLELNQNEDITCFEASLLFLRDTIDDALFQNFLKLALNNEIYIQIFFFMINLLKEFQQNDNINLCAVHIINQLFQIIPINKSIFEDIFKIGNYFLLQNNSSNDEFILLMIECFQLIQNQNKFIINHSKQIIHLLRDDNGKIQYNSGKVHYNNGKVYYDNGKVHYDNGKIHYDNGKSAKNFSEIFAKNFISIF